MGIGRQSIAGKTRSRARIHPCASNITQRRSVSGWTLGTIATMCLAAGCADGLDPVLTGNGPTGGGGSGGPPVVANSVASEEQLPIASWAQPGDLVGQLELAAPGQETFVLHGTLPVPRGTFVPGVSDQPFQLVDAQGTTWDTQVEPVTRYPDETDGADVVELIARVTRPTGVAPGDRLRYDVRYQHHASTSFQPDATVTDLLNTPAALVLRTNDVFGHRYQADLFADARNGNDSLRVLKQGCAEVQVATHEVLKPIDVVDGAQGTLPHHLGVHSYVTQFSGERHLELDLRVHNGFSGRDTQTTDDDPIGKAYFDAVELVVPQGWKVVSTSDDPFVGTPYDEDGARVYPIVDRIDTGPNGQLHMMPAMGQFHRRLAVVRDGSEAAAESSLAQEGLAFARAGVAENGHEWFSWWNPVTGRWFSQRQALPSLAPATETEVRAMLAGDYAGVANQVATGSTGLFPIEAGNMGWAHPWGINDGGMVSGSEIFLYDGVDVAWSASREGYLLHELCHRMYSDRQPNVMFDVDGRHTNVTEWTVHAEGGEYLPIWWFNSPLLWASDPFGYDEAPTAQCEAVANAGRKPWYEDELLGYAPIDLQHLVRYTRSAKVLLWLGNDAIAREDLCAQAEGFRLGYSSLPQDLWGNIIPTGLRAMQNFTTNYPNRGLPFGRGESWGLDAALVAYSVGDDAWRAQARPWFDTILAVLEQGQTECTSVIQATPQYNVFGAQYRCRQSIEAAIMENALVGLRETVYLGSDRSKTERLDALLRRAFYAMISPLVWSPVHHGPWAMMAVGPFDLAEPPYCTWIPADGNYGFADHYQIWSSFAYAWQITHDPVFLERAAEAMGSSDFLTGALHDPLANWQNRAALMTLAQRMAAQNP